MILTCRRCHREVDAASAEAETWRCIGDFDSAVHVCPTCRTEEAREAREEQLRPKYSDPPPRAFWEKLTEKP